MARVTRPRVTGVVAMVVAVAFSSWLVVQHDGSSALPVLSAGSAPAAVPESGMSEEELRARARTFGQPLYWGGSRPGARYDLARDAASGAAVIGYFAPGASGQGAPAELTIATIPLADAYVTTERLAVQPGAVSRRLAGGALAWSSAARPSTAYVVRPGENYVVEVQAPSPGEARELAFSGRIIPLG